MNCAGDCAGAHGIVEVAREEVGRGAFYRRRQIAIARRTEPPQREPLAGSVGKRRPGDFRLDPRKRARATSYDNVFHARILYQTAGILACHFLLSGEIHRIQFTTGLFHFVSSSDASQSWLRADKTYFRLPVRRPAVR